MLHQHNNGQTKFLRCKD